MTTKEKVHRLVDELPSHELRAAERYLEYLRNIGTDPVLRAFMEAPLDDEEITPEDEQAIDEAETELARGEGRPFGGDASRFKQLRSQPG